MEAFAAILMLISGILGVLHLRDARKRAEEEHPAIEYEEASLPVEERWRWRQPSVDIGLEVEDSSQVSSISLPIKLEVSEYIMPIFGYLLGFLFVGSMLLGSVKFLILKPSGEYLGFLLLCLPFLILPYSMIRVGERITRIEFHKDHMLVVLRWGIFLHRRVRVSAHPNLKVVGKLQSSWGMTEDQEVPLFRLNVSTPGILGKRWTWAMECNQTQGSWLVGGMRMWNRIQHEER